jgi:hypothetical protein
MEVNEDFRVDGERIEDPFYDSMLFEEIKITDSCYQPLNTSTK